MQEPHCDAINCDVNVQSTFFALGGGTFSTVVYREIDRDQSSWAQVAYCILYLNGNDMKIEFIAHILNFVPHTCDFRDGRYRELNKLVQLYKAIRLQLLCSVRLYF